MNYYTYRLKKDDCNLSAIKHIPPNKFFKTNPALNAQKALLESK